MKITTFIIMCVYINTQQNVRKHNHYYAIILEHVYLYMCVCVRIHAILCALCNRELDTALEKMQQYELGRLTFK